MSLGFNSISEVSIDAIEPTITAPANATAETSPDVQYSAHLSQPGAAVGDATPAVSYSAHLSQPGAAVADATPSVVASLALSFPAAATAETSAAVLFNLIASAAVTASAETSASVIALAVYTDPNRLFTADNERRLFVVGDDDRRCVVPARERMVA